MGRTDARRRQLEAEADSELLGDGQKKRQGLQLALYLLGAVFIVVGMFSLSGFLSGGIDSAKDKTRLAIMGGIVLIMAIGIVYLKVTGKKADK